MAEQQQQYLPTQVPRFELNINDEQLQNLLRDIQFNMANQATELERLKKELERKPSDFLISEANIILGGEIDIDPMLSRLVRTKEKKRQEEASVIKKSARDLGKKLCMLSDAVNYLFEQSKGVDKRLTAAETDLPKDIADKTKGLDKRLEEARESFGQDLSLLTERLESRHHEQTEQVREVQKKTLWQINDCKVGLESRITEQYVKDAMNELETKMTNRMKEYQVRSNIDPDRVIKLEGRIAKMDNDFSLTSVELSHKLKIVAERIETTLMTRSQFTDDRVELEKRMAQINGNISDLNRRITSGEQSANETSLNVKQISELQGLLEKQVKRINDVLKHLKLGEQFQKMIEKLDPHKICQMDGQIQILNLNDSKFEKEFDLLKKEVDKIRSKNSYVNSLEPTSTAITTNSKLKREDIEDVFSDFMANNLYIRKIQQIESTVADFRNNTEQLNVLEKRISKMQKESDLHNIIYQMKGLEEFVKREVLILGNRVSQLEALLKEEVRIRQTTRPTSATKTLANSRSNSTVNVKKLFPVNCIGCYETPGVYNDSTDSFTRAKAYTALGSSRR